MVKPVVRREGTTLVVRHVTQQQFKELCSCLRMHFGGRLADGRNPDGSYTICFAETIERKFRSASTEKKLRRPVPLELDRHEEFMKQARATAMLIIQTQEQERPG